jgi:Ni,Fe-hydrogenase III small subunit/ferredoxin
VEQVKKKRDPLWAILTTGLVTQRELCPDLPPTAAGLPQVTGSPCEGAACQRCVEVCPTQAIQVTEDTAGGVVALDRGRCIACSACVETCPSGTLAPDLSTRTAVRTRDELILTNRASGVQAFRRSGGIHRDGQDQQDENRPEKSGYPVHLGNPVHPVNSEAGPERLNARTPERPRPAPFRRSLHIREVSTGCSATDLEVAAINNPIFDVARFGVQFVASPRFADALLVTGPVGRAMQEPLRRCFDAMAEPRLVIAAGTCAISGGLHRGGYAEANGVAEILPVAAYVPGCPPHPWSIIHAILLAMGRG